MSIQSFTRSVLAIALLMSLLGASQETSLPTYPPIATAPELVSRLMTPVAAEAVRRRIRLRNLRVQERMFDIVRERFTLFVPRREPPAGYGLMIFIPPWPTAQVPPGWAQVLERQGVIFVSADKSGNGENVLERRIPLALAELDNIERTYRIDPLRTFVGGFSGGARVALRIALAYPDLFAGALLNAGSDPIGEQGTALPEAHLFLRFQRQMKLVYATGAEDESALALDSASRGSMAHWCVANIAVREEPRVGHDPASPYVLDWAIQALDASPKPDSAPLAKCRAARAEAVSGALDQAEAAIGEKQTADAKREILEIDLRYGGLAAPRSIELADRCTCGLLDPEGVASVPTRPASH